MGGRSGTGAAGGTLALNLETLNYGRVDRQTLKGENVDDAVRLPHELLLSERQGESALAPGLRAGQGDAGLKYGAARLGADRVRAGGFDNLALLSNGLITFDGNLHLALGQSLRLTSGALALAEGVTRAAQISLAAPYIRWSGISRNQLEDHIMPNPVGGSAQGRLGVPLVAAGSSLLLDAGLLDVGGRSGTGAAGLIVRNADTDLRVERMAFDQTTLRSSGDLRFYNAAALNLPGDVTLAAAQIYPASGDSGTVVVGRYNFINAWNQPDSGFDPARHLNIQRSGAGATPAAPFSVFGKLSLSAATINQGGVLRAPLGQITFGAPSGGEGQGSSRVNLLEGSLSSVSAQGLSMPYGGTLDGLNYMVNGKDVELAGVGNGPAINFVSQAVDVARGAVLDLSGGGDLKGAAFLSGRGGSSDARLNPLAQGGAQGGFTLPGLASNPVYAIVPGAQPFAAPRVEESGAGMPGVGRQITLGAGVPGVPGLPAGTYTLLPSSFALLPGAFRVELNGLGGLAAAGPALSMRNGSFAAAAQLGVAGTSILSAAPSQVIVTPADVLRRYSQYNETSYAQFVLGEAQRDGVPRAVLERDAKTLKFQFNPRRENWQNSAPALRFAGTALYTPGEGGYGGSVLFDGGYRADYEILGGGAATPDFEGTSLRAADINAIGAQRIGVGGIPTVIYNAYNTRNHQGANIATLSNASGNIVLREGALLKAAEVYLVTNTKSGGITLEQGAGINTLGQGKAAWDSGAGYVYDPGINSVLAVSNGRLDLKPSTAGPDADRGAGRIDIGACAAGAVCAGVSELYSEGTLTAITDQVFNLDDKVRYGTRNLTLAMGAINAGGEAALLAARERGALTPGLALNQDLLDRLLRGDTAHGAPALENLQLTARDAINFYGAVNLSTLDASGKSSLKRLVLGSPAMYGYGGAADVARIQTDTLVWSGSAGAPGNVAAQGAGTGAGRLRVDARRIEFGSAEGAQQDSIHEMKRLALGFAQVDLNAAERITASNKNALAVYQSQGGWNEATHAFDYQGGQLNLNTPLLTGRAGSVSKFSAGADLRVSAPDGAAAAAVAAAESLGAEIALSGANVSVDTTLVLPSGKLSVAARRDLLLGERAKLDLAGRKLDFYDVSKYSWGGDVVLDSAAGDIRQAAGSRIDLSARFNRAGKLSAAALGQGAGTVDLRGQLLGAAEGQYDAGGTQVPFAAGGADIRAQRIADFAGLNQRLNSGAVFGARSFQLKQGDLTVGDEVRAREVNISVDGGALTVAGTINAAGAQVGSIRLAGAAGVTLKSGARLDAHGSVLRVDSYGQAIEAPNRAVIEISSGAGRLTLEDGAQMDLRAAGAGYGSVDLNAPRLGGNDIDIAAAGAVRIDGARSVNLNAFRNYEAGAPVGGAAADGRPYQSIDQDFLNRAHRDSDSFIDLALANGQLMNGKLAGLRGAAFHLRPGVQISAAGDLHVDGDLDLSGQRYASVNPLAQRGAVYGSGEAGALVLRAAGKLSVFGSINDGFDTSALPVTGDDAGWVLLKGRTPWGGEIVVPRADTVTLAAGTFFQPGKVLNYAVPLQAMSLAAGTLLAARATLTAELVLPAGTVLGGALRDAAGRVLLPAGSVLGAAMTLSKDMQLDAGNRLPGAANVAALRWPAGVALPFPNGEVRDMGDAWSVPNGPILASDLVLGKGALIPSETMVRLPGDAALVKLRLADAAGNQGRNLALAPMLAEGSQAWSLRLVGGADLAAADSRALLPRGAHGGVLLSDVHYGMGIQTELVPGSGLPGQYVYAGDSETYLGHAPGTPVDIAEWGTENDVVGLNDWGRGVMVIKVADGTPPEYVGVTRPVRQQLFSVLRTGAADLDLIAGADLAMSSPYGVYTAGTQSARLGGAADPYNQRRGRSPSGKVLGASLTDALYEPLVDGGTASLYRAWYPEHGGNLLLRAQGDVTGDLIGQSRGNRNDDLIGPLRGHLASTPLGNWLWRQGSGSAVSGAEGLPGAWWINFGTYVAGPESGYGLFETAPYLVGFTGVGTLGGGNLVLEAGGDAGMLARLGDAAGNYNARSQGLNVAIGGSGRVGPDGKLVQTGGGDLDIRVGGGLNPTAEVRSYADRGGVVTPQTRFQSTRLDLNSTFTNLRGALRLEAGGVGGVELRYDRADAAESRAYTEGRATSAIAGGGPVLVPGDAGVRIDARGDLVLGGVGDPGRVAQLNNGTPFVSQGVAYQGEGWSWFSLWTPATAVDLFSAGGNLTPSTGWMNDINRSNHSASDGRFVYPSVLRAVAASGNLYYGSSSSGALDGSNKLVQSGTGVLLAPAPVAPQFGQGGGGQLELLAADSIYAGGYALTQSGADPRALPDPFKPGFAGATGKAWYGPTYVNNLDPLALAPSVWFASRNGAETEQRYPLFSMTSPGAADYAPAHQAPSRFYALAGDIVGLRSGSSLAQATGTWYEAGAPLAIRAGRDLVNSGTALGELEAVPQEGAGWVNDPRNQRPDLRYSGGGRGNLALHRHADDVSVVSAGRDILGGTFYVAGPGTLEVTAGRDLYLGDKGELKSLGPLPGGTGGGADIAIASGVGKQGADYAAFAKRYLDPANLATPGLALAGQAGKVVESYGGALTLADWLRREFAYAGDAAGAPAFLAQRQSALDAARLSDPAAPRRQLAREYALTGQLYLVNWLGARFGAGNGLGLRFEAGVSDARAFFAALPAEQQRAYLRNVYFAELKAAGREYNEAGGARQGSYLRGRDAIATLFPARAADGKELNYKGDLTMFSSANYYLDSYAPATKRPLPGKQYLSRAEHRAAGNPGDIGYYDQLDGGVHTDFGGAISVLAPGGRTLVGVDGGFAPGSGSGLLTQGEGEIGIYARDSILLGQSRIFTTFGGNILAWSAQGDINAGRGAKTTVVFTPQRRVYDGLGNVTLSPTTPSSGAGIATLNPIPEVPPGDIDLIAPLGSIDAGEAGIRVSGNVNLAALQVVNAANIQVQGKSVGVPTVAAVNVGALSNASAAAAQATTAAQDMLQRERAGARQAQPSVFTVRVLGFGAEAEPVKGRNELGAAAPVYQNDGVVQVLGAGPLGEAEKRALR
ncbi:filamentous hemagglutinin family protein [Janthinobacterium sp.]|uniref:filamentous haemagglutinin family protein n=1 Tax=Janthinobacterium sp. TaxID=1871054 RepID=UPI00293DA118|nr:filamentous hemagglutinin family protein [Janthinobacterium sp.]